MLAYTILVWLGLVAGVTPLQTPNGWFIDQVNKSNANGREQWMISANRMKMISLEDGKPVNAMIMDMNQETITFVNYEQRGYATTTVPEFAKAMIQMLQSAASTFSKQLEEQLKELPPEERESRKKEFAQLTPQTAVCSEHKVETRKTSERATMSGYPAVRYDEITDGEPTSQLWLASGLPIWRELDPKKLQTLGTEMRKLAGCNQGQGRTGLFGNDASWTLTNEGFPVRTVEEPGGETIEVVKAESRAIAATEFAPPAGFVRKTLAELWE